MAKRKPIKQAPWSIPQFDHGEHQPNLLAKALLCTLTRADLKWLADNGRVNQLSAGAIVVTERSATKGISLVLDGTLSVTRAREQLTTLEMGCLIGEVSFLTNQMASATVTASANATVFEISHTKLRSKLKTDSRFAARWYRILGGFAATRLRDALGDDQGHYRPDTKTVRCFEEVLKRLTARAPSSR